MHLLALAKKVKEGVMKAGLIGFQFNTIGVRSFSPLSSFSNLCSDGISMGTTGMRYSLQSRDIIADSIETVTQGQWYDANISLPGCDKNMVPDLINSLNTVARLSHGNGKIQSSLHHDLRGYHPRRLRSHQKQ